MGSGAVSMNKRFKFRMVPDIFADDDRLHFEVAVKAAVFDLKHWFLLLIGHKGEERLPSP